MYFHVRKSRITISEWNMMILIQCTFFCNSKRRKLDRLFRLERFALLIWSQTCLSVGTKTRLLIWIFMSARYRYFIYFKINEVAVQVIYNLVHVLNEIWVRYLGYCLLFYFWINCLRSINIYVYNKSSWKHVRYCT